MSRARLTPRAGNVFPVYSSVFPLCPSVAQPCCMSDLQPKNRRAQAVLSLIGDTPLVPLRFEREGVTIHAKCEFRNPSGSVKDRLAKSVLLDAEARGELRPESIILECGSGNPGIALSMVGAGMGYRVTILRSSSPSQERRRLI